MATIQDWVAVTGEGLPDERLLTFLYHTAWKKASMVRISELFKNSDQETYMYVREKEEELRESIKQKLQAAWTAYVKAISAALEALTHATTEGDTKLHNKGQVEMWTDRPEGRSKADHEKRMDAGDATGAVLVDGGRSKAYASPTHTDIAKDFSPEHAHKGSSERHAGAWIAPMADKLAKAATKDALGELQKAWHGANAEERAAGVSELDAKCKQWFSHPEDNRTLWESIVKGELKPGSHLYKELKERLSVRG